MIFVIDQLPMLAEGTCRLTSAGRGAVDVGVEDVVAVDIPAIPVSASPTSQPLGVPFGVVASSYTGIHFSVALPPMPIGPLRAKPPPVAT